MDELKKLLFASVPLIGSVIGTASPIAGVLFSTIAHMFGLETNAQPSDVARAIANDPDHDIKLRKLEIDHQDAILHESAQIRLGAYERESSITKITGKKDGVMGFLAIFIVVAFFTLAIVAFCVPLDQAKSNLCYFLLGVFGSGGFSVVVNYYFGNSLSPPLSIEKPNLPKNLVLPPPAQTK